MTDRVAVAAALAAAEGDSARLMVGCDAGVVGVVVAVTRPVHVIGGAYGRETSAQVRYDGAPPTNDAWSVARDRMAVFAPAARPGANRADGRTDGGPTLAPLWTARQLWMVLPSDDGAPIRARFDVRGAGAVRDSVRRACRTGG